MLKALEGRSACLLGNHGQIAFGPNLEKALWRAGEVETISHQYWAALQAGKPVLLDDAQMATVLARFKSYGKQSDELGKDEAHAVFAPVRADTPKKDKKKVKKAK
jgi:L-fuculose-phosphate aldolase